MLLLIVIKFCIRPLSFLLESLPFLKTSPIDHILRQPSQQKSTINHILTIDLCYKLGQCLKRSPIFGQIERIGPCGIDEWTPDNLLTSEESYYFGNEFICPEVAAEEKGVEFVQFASFLSVAVCLLHICDALEIGISLLAYSYLHSCNKLW